MGSRYNPSLDDMLNRLAMKPSRPSVIPATRKRRKDEKGNPFSIQRIIRGIKSILMMLSLFGSVQIGNVSSLAFIGFL
jgi:hypothetical protein